MEEAGVAPRAERMLARIERTYLTALRVALLLLATGLIVYAVWLAVSGLYYWSSNPASVKEAPVEITPQEVAAVPDEPPTGSSAPNDPWVKERSWYKGFVDRYYALYAGRYDRFRQPADEKLSREAFDARYIQTADRLQALERGDQGFDEDRSRLERLLTTMSAVATSPETTRRLTRYQHATRSKVSRTVTGTRSERYCSYFGEYINECIIWSTRQVPTSHVVTETRLQPGVMEPATLFGRQQERFLDLLSSRTQASTATARDQRARIVSGNQLGTSRLWAALGVVAGFLLLMFLFLLIAIERHQRRQAGTTAATPAYPDVVPTAAGSTSL